MTRFTKLFVGTLAVFGLGSGVYTGINAFVDSLAIQTLIVVNVQTSLTGTGAGANSSKLYDYSKYSGYKPLIQTGGVVSAVYQIANFDFPETYTGVVLGAGICIDVATAPTSNATFVDCSIQGDTLDTSSGTDVFNNLNLIVATKPFCGGTGATIGPGQQFVCYSSFGSGAGLEADFNIHYRESELN